MRLGLRPSACTYLLIIDEPGGPSCGHSRLAQLLRSSTAAFTVLFLLINMVHALAAAQQR